MGMENSSEDKRPPRSQGKSKNAMGEEAIWRKPDYRVVEASMEITAYFLTR
jgi:coenzyme PQQ precursor peptide PqqA